ncbi:MAG: tetratricopeptide repeat protein [Proteobacteria bacterium]|nr:tetratricopeptide repeat protein [Pseudomonadota bacterium]
MFTDLADAPLGAGNEAARGVALLREGRHAEALEALRAAAALGDASPVTALNAALALEGAGEAEAALTEMAALEARHPGWDEPPLRIAECLRRREDRAGAEAAYRRVLAIDPMRAEALIGLGVLRMQAGEAAEACLLLAQSCALWPDRADAWDALGLAHAQAGDAAAACAAFAEARARSAGRIDIAVRLAEAAAAAGRLEAECARLEAAAARDPLDVSAHVTIGLIRERLRDRDGAADALEVAVALAPDAPGPLGLLGGMLARAHRLRDAERVLRRAAEAEPDNPRIQNDLAAVLMRLQRHPEAQRILLALRERHGASPAELANLATATLSVGRQREAQDIAAEAVARAPDALLPRRAFYNCLVYQDATPAAALLRAARDCAACLPAPRDEAWPNPPDPRRRLRVGLLSGALKTHPVGWLTVAGFESLDPDAFALVCLGPQAADDPMARRFAAIAREWHDTDGLEDEALAALGRALALDVLVDLGGWGDTGRLAACALRFAPVQVKWVGMQAHTSGVPAMDWFLTDPRETPDGYERFYTERLLRLPDGYVCYSPPPHAPDVAPLPALARGHVTFGCFNNLAKVTPAVIAAWCRILHRVPDARFVLKAIPLSDAEIAADTAAEFARHGIGADRLELRGGSAHRYLLGQYADIDIHLDPFPYSGGLTTCEALWMGVPTVTMPGESFASRHSASHMTNAGLGDWVAPDLAGYEALAVAKAADIAALAALRAGLRARVKASPLCDARRFGRNLGAALRHAWRDWCARQTQAEPNRAGDAEAA